MFFKADDAERDGAESDCIYIFYAAEAESVYTYIFFSKPSRLL